MTSSPHAIVLYYCTLNSIRTGKNFYSQRRDDFTKRTPKKAHPKNKSPADDGLSHSYLETKLRPSEEKGYKAAGVLPIAFFSASNNPTIAQTLSKKSSTQTMSIGNSSLNEITRESSSSSSAGHTDSSLRPYVLLGTEIRFEKKTDLIPQFNFLGGKREASDENAGRTAVREFWEESGQLISHEDVGKIFNDLTHFDPATSPSRVFWHYGGKYALFLYHLPVSVPQWALQLVEAYKNSEARPPGSEMDALYWVELAHLVSLLKMSQPEISLEMNGRTYKAARFMASVLRSHALVSYLESLLNVDTASTSGTSPVSKTSGTQTN
jgi:8-oxo-dGTP pyrophosphatase MutT (NUDIX family)